MADTNYVTIPELTEITRAETTDTAMLETAVEDQLTPTGYGSRRITLSSIASYVLSNFSSLSLGGVTRTVKAAIDAIATLLGSSSMGTTATTVTEAVSEVNTKANTNADNITTLTNSVNDLNSHLSDLDSLLSVKTGTFASAISGASNNLNVWQSGNVVTVSGWLGSLSLTANTTTVIGTIRNVTLPRANIRLRGGCGANAYSPQSDCYIGIGTDGGISVNPSVASSTLYFTVTYIA